MGEVIRGSRSHHRISQAQSFNWDDMVQKADAYLQQVRQQASGIIAEARRQAEALALEARQQGRQAAVRQAEEQMQEELRNQLSSLVPALQQAVRDIQHSKQSWLRHWEATTIKLATAIAERLVQRELERRPEISIAWIREALTLAVGSGRLKLHLNPEDHTALGGEVRRLVAELGELAATEIVADPEVSPGGCRVLTQFGEVDQRLEARLQRIREELE